MYSCAKCWSLNINGGIVVVVVMEAVKKVVQRTTNGKKYRNSSNEMLCWPVAKDTYECIDFGDDCMCLLWVSSCTRDEIHRLSG